jgi:DNA-binding beta-propeller fold protein YncE
VAVGPQGTVYVADAGAHRVRALGPGGLFATVAGTGEEGDDGDGGAAVAAKMDQPVGLALVGETLFVADSASHRVRAVSLADGTIEAAVGSGDAGFGGDGRAGAAARLSAPQGLAAADGGATLFVADAGNHRVRVFDRATGIVRTFAGTGETAFEGDGLPAGATALDEPWALALAGSVLFVADRGQFIVWRTEVLGDTE